MGEGHTRSPDWLMERTDVSVGAKAVWACFRRLTRTQACFPSYETVARMTGLNRRQVMRYVDELEAKWLLEIRIVSFTGTEFNEHGYRTNLFITHDGKRKNHYLTRFEQREARRLKQHTKAAS